MATPKSVAPKRPKNSLWRREGAEKRREATSGDLALLLPEVRAGLAEAASGEQLLEGRGRRLRGDSRPHVQAVRAPHAEQHAEGPRRGGGRGSGPGIRLKSRRLASRSALRASRHILNLCLPHLSQRASRIKRRVQFMNTSELCGLRILILVVLLRPRQVNAQLLLRSGIKVGSAPSEASFPSPAYNTYNIIYCSSFFCC